MPDSTGSQPTTGPYGAPSPSGAVTTEPVQGQRTGRRATAIVHTLGTAERVHEMHNLLTAIQGAAQILQVDYERHDDATRRLLIDALRAEVDQMRRLVDAAGALAVSPFPLAATLTPVITCARTLGTDVTFSVDKDLVAVGYASETAQVLRNLLENARRYGGGCVTVRAALSGRRIAISVEDDGPGIPPDEQEMIFDRGTRGASATGTSGSGLGLAISRALMRQQGGDLLLNATAAHGARFVMVIPGYAKSEQSRRADDPVDRGEEVIEAAGSGEADGAAHVGDRQRIRSVDDEDGVRHDVS